MMSGTAPRMPRPQISVEPNLRDLTDFIYAMFAYAETGTFVSLRAFPERDGPPLFIEAIEVAADSLDNIVRRAVTCAKEAARRSGVFCPPIATFDNPDNARAADLAQGLALSVDLDAGDISAAAELLTRLLGPPTVIVESGGTWKEPESGRGFAKQHLHWRLSLPTETPEQHVKLRQARALACALVGGDPTTKPLVHPLRWPGSWHLKQKPTLARIIGRYLNAEIDLDAALLALEAAAEAAGMADARKVGVGKVNGHATAPAALIASAAAVLPNDDEHWNTWSSKIGMAIYAATDGSQEGYAIWRDWSAKSAKHSDKACEVKWRHLHDSPPDQIGAGTIFFWALKLGWQWPTGQVDANLLLLDPEKPVESARALVTRDYTHDGVRTLHHQQGTFYRWVGSHYIEMPDEEVRAKVYNFLDGAQRRQKDKLVPFDPNKARVANVLEALEAVTQLENTVQPPCMLDDPDDPCEVMACRNGLLHLRTRTLRPHTPRFFNVNALTYDYDPHAPKPVEWLKFLKSVWPDDQPSIDALQEHFAVLVSGLTIFQKILLIIGPPRSGKGTIGRLLVQLLGRYNVCAPKLHELGTGSFVLQQMIGKLLCLITDARNGKLSNPEVAVERLLSISGMDPQSIPRKYKQDWQGILLVRLVILANVLPRFDDSSAAIAGRMIVLRMTESFLGREDPLLGDKLQAELSGILNWSLKGFDRLIERSHLLQPPSGVALVDQLAEAASAIKTFVRDWCVTGQDESGIYQVRVGRLYENWCKWCELHNRMPGNDGSFGRNLHAACPRLEVKRESDGRRPQYYVGIGLRADYQQK
jgi:putative DNA primase/helicase